jgi:alpha-glucosidase (family GH31 glycosyl hydrolase)
MLEKKSGVTVFGKDLRNLKAEVTFEGDYRIHLKVTDPNKARYEVPLTINPAKDHNTGSRLFDVAFIEEDFSIRVTRKSTGAVVFDTSLGPMVFSDQFLMLAAKLPGPAYGIGENEHPSFQHQMNYKSWPLYGRDQPPVPNINLYGSQPFLMAMETGSTNAIGIAFLNSNPQEIQLTPAPGVVFRTIGGILDFYVFLGPSPDQVIQQFTEAVGRPFMPAYWTLGFQLCRYGYNNFGSLKGAVDRMRKYDIPHDAQYLDIDGFEERTDFTYNKQTFGEMPNYIRQLRREGTRFITILDPCIPYTKHGYAPYEQTRGKNHFWVRTRDGRPAEGKVWPPGPIYFVDFSNKEAQDWWVKQIVDFRPTLEYDALWIDMNEPANFVAGSPRGCSGGHINNPPYKPQSIAGSLYEKTVCPDFIQDAGKLYDVHNMYGYFQSEPTQRGVYQATGRRGMVLSRSTFLGSGKYAGHWLGDNFAQWNNMKNSIVGMLEFNLFGIPYVGADICGFINDAQEEMCLRWHQLGAFYPFARNHNGEGYKHQDPGIWGQSFAQAVRKALHTRYTMLPYLYTLFYRAHTTGSTVARSLLFNFPEDKKTWRIDRQFMWGDAILITPVLQEHKTDVTGYFPDARWYDFHTMKELGRTGQVTLSAPRDHINVHFRGGFIIPCQAPGRATEFTRKNPMDLRVPLDKSGSAVGSLYYDDGETIEAIEKGQYIYIDYTANESGLTSTVGKNGWADAANMKYGTVFVLGIKSAVTTVTVNGASATFSLTDNTLKIENIGVKLTENLDIKWS